MGVDPFREIPPLGSKYLALCFLTDLHFGCFIQAAICQLAYHMRMQWIAESSVFEFILKACARVQLQSNWVRHLFNKTTYKSRQLNFCMVGRYYGRFSGDTLYFVSLCGSEKNPLTLRFGRRKLSQSPDGGHGYFEYGA